MKLLVQFFLVEYGQQLHTPAQERRAILGGYRGGGKRLWTSFSLCMAIATNVNLFSSTNASSAS